MTAMQSLRRHWPEYLMEAWGLGSFMLSAALFVVLLESPASPLPGWIGNAEVRRALLGAAMGLTAIGIIYSPWGRQSGAHINPAVTLAFLRMGKIARWDAVFYIAAQFAGGTLGVLLALLLIGDRFARAPVSYVVTVPGSAGIGAAFAGELLISFGLMLAVLMFMGVPRIQRYTGVAAGALVAIYIALEAPLSGMSMNPARTFASAAPAGIWSGWWIYFIAPTLGMLLAAEIRRVPGFDPARLCAKLFHAADRRCIHCGYEPVQAESREDQS